MKHVKRVENTTRSRPFLTNFEVFQLVMKHCVEGKIKEAKMSSVSSDFQTLIKQYFPLYYLYEF